MKDSAINVRISGDKKEAIVTRAKELNLSISKYIIEAIDEKLIGNNGTILPNEGEMARSLVKFSEIVNNDDAVFKEDMAKAINGISKSLIKLTDNY